MTYVQNLPIGIYTKTTGTTTISANALQAPSLSKLLLLDKTTGTTTDLLTSTYSFIANAGTDNTRFQITAQRVLTANVINEVSGEVKISMVNGGLVFANISPSTIIRVYDAIGRMVANKTANGNSLEIKLNGCGMYSIQIQTGNTFSTRKVIL
jgi:hypothetical protein